MPRQLPTHPNLEYLKKRAKDLLAELRARDPALQLADAQHALAQEYGFARWPKLKQQVDSTTSAPSPLAGKWIADLSNSKPHPGNPFGSATVEFTISGDSIQVFDTVVDAEGRAQRTRNRFLADGKEHPAENNTGYVMTAHWRGPYVVETTAAKDGQPAGWGRYEVSADGQTLIITGENQRVVLRRA